MKKIALLVSLASFGFAGIAQANPAGTWTLAVGAANVDPQSDNGALDDGTQLNVDDNVQFTVAGEYFVRDNLGIEVLAATPFNHTVSIPGVGEVAETDQLPPTVTLQYYFGDENSAIRPFVGAGVNYTLFYNEGTSNALSGVDLNIKNSFGVTARAGADLRLSDTLSLRADIRWIDISPTVELNGVDAGQVDIDPLVYGAAIVRKF